MLQFLYMVCACLFCLYSFTCTLECTRMPVLTFCHLSCQSQTGGFEQIEMVSAEQACCAGKLHYGAVIAISLVCCLFWRYFLIYAQMVLACMSSALSLLPSC